ncbi:hypothetical protein YSY43_17490 [Paenibacillus sp. YSY-4.3]
MVERLEQFKLMINVFDEKNINITSYLEWAEIDEEDESPAIPVGYPKCQKHGTYLSCHGCILCNNES